MRRFLRAAGGLGFAIALATALLLSLVPAEPAAALAEPCSAGQTFIPGGRFRLGAAGQLPEEQEATGVRIRPFCLQTHEVTNREFTVFVAATGYRTVAERPLSQEQFPELSAAERRPGSVVFRPPSGSGPIEELSWWQWVPGADWRHPQGPDSGIAGLEEHPVVQVALEDAEAYARWAGGELPSEAQWEFAARGGLRDQVFSWGNTWKPGLANTFQGEFPGGDSAEDGHAGTAPVGAYPANGYGLFDMTGNVWEWTADWYRPDHSGAAGGLDPRMSRQADSSDPREPGVAKHVIKGGSFLCSPDYCSRYRPAAREAESPDTGTSHIGFRLVYPASPIDG